MPIILFEALAMANALQMPSALSMAAIMRVLPRHPSSFSTFSISASNSRTSSAVSVFGMRITCTPAFTTASTSLRP